MVTEGMRNVVAGNSAAGISRSLWQGLQVAISALDKVSRPVKDISDTAHVATVSTHGDAEIGRLVADAVEMVGGEGVVDGQDARSTETTLEAVEVMQFDKGFLSPYFVTDTEQMRVELENPLIMLHDRKMTAMAPLLPLLESILQHSRPLVVIAETVEGEALAALVVNKIRGVLASVAVKAPDFGERRKAILEDLAIITGGRVISEELGDKPESITTDDLGTANRVVVDKDTTTVIGGGGSQTAIEARKTELRRQIEMTTSDWDREKLEERLAKLAEGIVPGGGTALLRVVEPLEAAAAEATGPEQVGMRLLARALEEPCRQLARNAGVDEGVVIDRVRHESGFYGFDTAGLRYGDLDSLGIIDATKVARTALTNAVSVADTLLLTQVVLTDVEEPLPRSPATPDLV